MRRYLFIFSRIYLPMLLFGGSLLFGTLGYVVIERFPWLDALYMTVIALSTVGFMEVHPLTEAGRVFTIFLILFNIGIFTYFITVVSRFVFDGEFIDSYKSFKMKEALNRLNNHVIICGFGRNGREAATVLQKNGVPFVVVEQNMGKFEEADFPASHRLIADATKDEALLEAGIGRAKAMICALPEDADNVFVVLTARELNRSITIISRASEYTSVRKLKIAGANNVIMPDSIGGAHMAMLTLMPDVKEFIDLMGTQISEGFQIAELTVAHRMNLQTLDAWHTTGATVLGIKLLNNEYMLNPPPSTVLQPGDRLILMGSKVQIGQVDRSVG